MKLPYQPGHIQAYAVLETQQTKLINLHSLRGEKKNSVGGGLFLFINPFYRTLKITLTNDIGVFCSKMAPSKVK